MPNGPTESPWSSRAVPDLLSQASSVLAREASRIPATLLGIPSQGPSGVTRAVPGVEAVRDVAGRTYPVAGATIPLETPDQDRLRRQGHELVAALLSTFAPAAGNSRVPTVAQAPSGAPGAAAGLSTEIHRLASRVCPVTGAATPVATPDPDRLRRQAHEFIESLLVTFSRAPGEKAAPSEDQVPLIRCVAPVQAGDEGFATVRVANDENTPSDVALYCTNFVADSGYEIPSLRVTVSPRRVTIPPKGEAAFAIKIAVSQQTPAGIYSGLIQAMGSKYIKTVLSVEVL